MPNKYLGAVHKLLKDAVGDDLSEGALGKVIGTSAMVLPSIAMSHSIAKESLRNGKEPDAKRIAKNNFGTGALEGALLALNHRSKSGPINRLSSWKGGSGMAARMAVYGAGMGALDAGVGALEAARLKRKYIKQRDREST